MVAMSKKFIVVKDLGDNLFQTIPDTEYPFVNLFQTIPDTEYPFVYKSE